MKNCMVGEKGLVSVLIPVFNSEKYIGECIDSICKQTYEKLEIIIIDDGSTDSSGEICEEFAQRDNRIRVIHEDHKGVSSSRNKALACASGEYVCFVDADDLIHQTMIQKLLDVMINQECDIVQCYYERFIEFPRNMHIDMGDDLALITFDREEAMWRLQAGNPRVSVMMWNKLFKKEIFSDISFPLRRIYEDEAVIHKVLFKSNKVAIIEADLYYYRMSVNSLIRSKFGIDKYDIVTALIERANFWKNNNLDDCLFVTVHKIAYVTLDLYRKTKLYYPYEKKWLNYLLDINRIAVEFLRDSPYISKDIYELHLKMLDAPDNGELYDYRKYIMDLKR